jgi:hypothetical protein
MAKKATKRRKKLFTIRMNEDEMRQFDRIAQQKGVSKADLLRVALDFMALNLFDLDDAPDSKPETGDHL